MGQTSSPYFETKLKKGSNSLVGNFGNSIQVAVSSFLWKFAHAPISHASYCLSSQSTIFPALLTIFSHSFQTNSYFLLSRITFSVHGLTTSQMFLPQKLIFSAISPLYMQYFISILQNSRSIYLSSYYYRAFISIEGHMLNSFPARVLASNYDALLREFAFSCEVIGLLLPESLFFGLKLLSVLELG